jgi:nitrate/nitrite-specific signal transduction histidine kinase
MQDYRKAVEILLPLTLKKEVINDKETYTAILNNLGYSYLKLGNSKSLHYLLQSLKISKQIKNEGNLIENYINLSEYYQKINTDLSKNYVEIAYKKATQAKMIDNRLESLKLLIEVSTGYQSKKYALDYIRINDSIIKARQMARNQFAKIKYDSKQVRGENQKLKIERVQNGILIVEQKNRILLLLLLITTTIATTLLIINFLSCKNRKEKIQTSIDTETRISKKLHDEVANDVYLTMAFAETQDLSTTQNKEILLSNLDNIYSATRSISRENNSINQNENFLEELKELLSEFNTATTNILVNGLDDIDWTAIENIKKITIYRVLQELLINMKKHSKCCLAVIIFKKNKNNLEINYSDNGAGASIDKITSGNGLQNVINRILDIKGNITFDTSPLNGFKSSITIPI